MQFAISLIRFPCSNVNSTRWEGFACFDPGTSPERGKPARSPHSCCQSLQFILRLCDALTSVFWLSLFLKTFATISRVCHLLANEIWTSYLNHLGSSKWVNTVPTHRPVLGLMHILCVQHLAQGLEQNPFLFSK